MKEPNCIFILKLRVYIKPVKWLACMTPIPEIPDSIHGYILFFSGDIGSGKGPTQPREDNWVAA